MGEKGNPSNRPFRNGEKERKNNKAHEEKERADKRSVAQGARSNFDDASFGFMLNEEKKHEEDLNGEKEDFNEDEKTSGSQE